MSDAVSNNATNVEQPKPEASVTEFKPVKAKRQDTARLVTGCPACRCESFTPVPKMKHLQCGRCHTLYIPDVADGDTVIVKTGKITNIHRAQDLQENLSQIFERLKPGEKVVVGDRLRVSEPYNGAAPVFLSIGGLAIAAEAVGFAPVDTSVQPIVLTKPIPPTE